MSGVTYLFDAEHFVTAWTLPRRAAAALVIAGMLYLPSAAAAADVTVFAAASLKNAVDAIAKDWEARTGHHVVVSYGGSSALAKQIEEGAPADLFLSAAVNWMDTLDKAGLVKAGTRHDLLGNALVLVAHGRDAKPVEIGPGFDLPGLLAGGKLAMAMVDSVPAGQYGKEALTTLGVWDAVAPSVAQAENVRAALALVTTGEAPFGIVYASDAVADDEAGDAVSVVGTFPADSHKPIIYPVAELTASRTPAAKDFLDALSSDEARRIFVAEGFVVLK